MNEDLASIHFCDPYSVLLIGSSGRITRLYCPFYVQCVDPVSGIAFKSVVIVEEVRMTEDDRLVYIIARRAYYHTNFHIQAGW